MMDYERRILELDKEVAHLREMKDLARGRMDLADNRLTRIEELLLENTRQLVTLGGNVEAIAVKLDTLISALLRDHGNGKT